MQMFKKLNNTSLLYNADVFGASKEPSTYTNSNSESEVKLGQNKSKSLKGLVNPSTIKEVIKKTHWKEKLNNLALGKYIVFLGIIDVPKNGCSISTEFDKVVEDYKERKDVKELKADKEGKEHKKSKEHKVNKEQDEKQEEYKNQQEYKEPKKLKEHKAHKDQKHHIKQKQHKNEKEYRDHKEHRNNKHASKTNLQRCKCSTDISNHKKDKFETKETNVNGQKSSKEYVKNAPYSKPCNNSKGLIENEAECYYKTNKNQKIKDENPSVKSSNSKNNENPKELKEPTPVRNSKALENENIDKPRQKNKCKCEDCYVNEDRNAGKDVSIEKTKVDHFVNVDSSKNITSEERWENVETEANNKQKKQLDHSKKRKPKDEDMSGYEINREPRKSQSQIKLVKGNKYKIRKLKTNVKKSDSSRKESSSSEESEPSAIDAANTQKNKQYSEANSLPSDNSKATNFASAKTKTVDHQNYESTSTVPKSCGKIGSESELDCTSECSKTKKQKPTESKTNATETISNVSNESKNSSKAVSKENTRSDDLLNCSASKSATSEESIDTKSKRKNSRRKQYNTSEESKCSLNENNSNASKKIRSKQSVRDADPNCELPKNKHTKQRSPKDSDRSEGKSKNTVKSQEVPKKCSECKTKREPEVLKNKTENSDINKNLNPEVKKSDSLKNEPKPGEKFKQPHKDDFGKQESAQLADPETVSSDESMLSDDQKFTYSVHNKTETEDECIYETAETPHFIIRKSRLRSCSENKVKCALEPCSKTDPHNKEERCKYMKEGEKCYHECKCGKMLKIEIIRKDNVKSDSDSTEKPQIFSRYLKNKLCNRFFRRNDSSSSEITDEESASQENDYSVAYSTEHRSEPTQSIWKTNGGCYCSNSSFFDKKLIDGLHEHVYAGLKFH